VTKPTNITEKLATTTSNIIRSDKNRDSKNEEKIDITHLHQKNKETTNTIIPQHVLQVNLHAQHVRRAHQQPQQYYPEMKQYFFFSTQQ